MSRELTIRPFEDKDTEAVVELCNVVFPGDPRRNDPRTVIRRKLEIQRHLFLVGEQAGVLLATVMAGFDGYRGWVYHLAVAPSHQRRGLGRAMMERAEAALIEMGCPKVNLQVRATNDAVVRFYEALGYDTEDRVSMGKPLE